MLPEPDALTEVDLQRMLRSIPAAVALVSVETGTVLFTNERAEALWGLPPATSTEPPRNVTSLVDGRQRAELVARVRAAGGVDAFPARMRRADGELVDVLASVRPIEVAGEACLLSVTYAVGEPTEPEEALRRSERRLRQIAETIEEGFVLASLRPFEILYASPAFAELVGTDLGAVYAAGPGPFTGIHADDQAAMAAALDQLRAGAATAEVEVRVERDGELRCLRYRWSAVEDRDQGAVVAGVVEDLTDSRRTDAELRRARAMAEEASRAKSALLSRVSHDLRSPLTVVLGFSQLLGDGELTTEQREAVQEIGSAGRRLLHLVEELLALSEAESAPGDRVETAVALPPVIRWVLDDLAPEAARRDVVIRDDKGYAGAVRADLRLLADALSQVVENAIVHNRAGGTVEVSCEPRPGGRVRIAISDTGPGISPEDLEQVHRDFEHRAAGAGSGLTVARRLVEAMGGELGVRSVPGRGSRFWLDIDAAPSPSGRARAAAMPASPGRRVLYIEDNASNAELAQRALAGLPDVELVLASTGGEGLARLAASPFDLVLLDLHLPDMGGDELLRRLRSDPATLDLPVVIISADALPAAVDRLRALGADDYLTKPVNVAHLVSVVDQQARRRRQEPTSGDAGSTPSEGSGRGGASGPVLDHAVLDELQVLEDLEPGTLGDVVELFAGSGAERLTAIEGALDRAGGSDLRAIAKQAHGLGGSGANLGAATLAEDCRVLEQLSEGADDEPVRAQAAVVRGAFHRAVVELRRHIATEGAGRRDDV